MAFKKGQSGNPKGRRRQSEEEKNLKVEFIKQLKHYAPEALNTLFEIMQDTKSKDRLKAAQYIIEKTFGNNFIAMEDENQEEEIVVRIIKCDKDNKKEQGQEEKEELEGWEIEE